MFGASPFTLLKRLKQKKEEKPGVKDKKNSILDLLDK